MSPTARALLFSCAPTAILAGWFGLISAINWDYEKKFFEPALIHGHADAWIGLKLFSVAIGFGVASNVFGFLALRHVTKGGPWKWLYFVAALLVSVVCFLMGLAFVAMGPAAITMLEQMTTAAS